jgi:hypothetical protein
VEEIIITIDNDANVEVAVKGVKGKSCKEITEKIEKAIGRVESSRTTAEFHQKGVKRAGH